MHQTFSQRSLGVTSEDETWCSLTSSGIIGEHLELLNWQMEVSKIIKEKGAGNCGQCVLEKNIYFTMIFPLFENLIIQ